MDDPNLLETIEIPAVNARVTVFDQTETPLLLTISTHRGGTFSYTQSLSVEAALKLMRALSDAVGIIHRRQRSEQTVEVTTSGFRYTQAPQMQQGKLK